MSPRRIYGVTAIRKWESEDVVRMFGKKAAAADFRHRCIQHDAKFPQRAVMVPDHLKGDAYEAAAQNFDAALMRWRKRHPAKQEWPAHDYGITFTNLWE